MSMHHMNQKSMQVLLLLLLVVVMMECPQVSPVLAGGNLVTPDASLHHAAQCYMPPSDCNLKEIVMKHIKVMESVNRSASNWKNVVDTKNGSTFVKAHYSESDVFSLIYRSMYLALAVKQFVLNVTGNLRTQWTWKKCLRYSIEAMNDVGIEFYSSFKTLARWHRKFARHKDYFYKAPNAKTAIPRFFVDNPDTMHAFKKHGVANIKDLRVEMMLEYVSNELVPKLMPKKC